jgi:hypothetical protein
VATALRTLAREVFAEQPAVEPVRVDRLTAGPEVAVLLSKLRDQARRQPLRASADRVTTAKAIALQAISQAPLVVNPTAVAQLVERVLAAPSVEAVRQAESALVSAAKVDHARILGEALVVACRQASIEAGFRTVETTSGLGGVLRVVATDEAGRALVSEIHRGDDTRPPSVETEVVGVTDRRCQAILDRFDAALDGQGVQTDGGPDRKWTGGVCELSLAREFVRQRIAPVLNRRPSSRTAPKRLARRQGPSRRHQG